MASGWARTGDGRLARPSANTHHRLGVRAGQDRRDPAMASRSGSREARPRDGAQEPPRFPAFIAPAPNAGDAVMTVPSPLVALRRGYVLRQAMSPEAKALQDAKQAGGKHQVSRTLMSPKRVGITKPVFVLICVSCSEDFKT